MKDKTSKAPAWMKAALDKKQMANESSRSSKNSSKDLQQKSSKFPTNSKSGTQIPHRPQK